jgi:leader peptidase (prepilin peptidase) / N-methyltransferase
MLPSPYDWIVPVVAGPFVGSFLGALAVRMPLGEDVVASRSRCRSCGATLGPAELIPVVSWLVQSGKCRACGAQIGWYYPVVELAALAVAVWAALTMEGAVLWVTIALGWTLLALVAMDLRALVLSDFLTLPLVAAGLAVTAWLDADAIPNHIAAAALGAFLIVAVAWVYRWMRGRDGLGMGDAKLMAAAGAWVGLEGLGAVMLYGVVATLALVLVKRWAGEPIGAETAVPLGAGLAVGLWFVWLYGPLMLVPA